MLERQSLIDILASDAKFLADHNLMDYSLLCGEIDCSEPQVLAELKEWTKDEKRRPQGIYINSTGSQAYVLAIIDALTGFDVKKKAEYVAKSVRYCGSTMSCIPPQQYATRFVEFVHQIFSAEEVMSSSSGERNAGEVEEKE